MTKTIAPLLANSIKIPENATLYGQLRYPSHSGSLVQRAAIEALAMASFWLACTCGGIGARTRRGLGGVRITGASGAELPEPWATDGALLTPGLDYYTQLRMIWPDGRSRCACGT